MLFGNGYDMPFCTVGVGLEHLPLRAEHREHAPLGVVGELEALAPVRLGIVLVGPDQPHHLAVAVVDGALHPAVPPDAPDLPVHQVVGILLPDGPWITTRGPSNLSPLDAATFSFSY